jgi:hypothetical protein
MSGSGPDGPAKGRFLSHEAHIQALGLGLIITGISLFSFCIINVNFVHQNQQVTGGLTMLFLWLCSPPIALGIFLRRYNNWARWVLGIVLIVACVLQSWFILQGSEGMGLRLLFLSFSTSCLWVTLCGASSEIFTKHYREIVHRTKRTVTVPIFKSFMSWIFAILVMGFIVWLCNLFF